MKSMLEKKYINSNGPFHNKCSNVISKVPVVDLAYLANKREHNSMSDSIVNLNPICLLWCDFYHLFFTSLSNSFYINPSSTNSCAVSFNNQTYESTQKKYIAFNLADQVKKAWSEKNSKLESQIPLKSNLQLNKDVFQISGLGNANYAVGQGLDQVLAGLLASRQIMPADSETSANVKFVVAYNFYNSDLDISVLVNFSYLTKIPCFKNVEDCDLCPYSNADKKCRPCFDYKDDDSAYCFSSEKSVEEYEIKSQSDNMSDFITYLEESSEKEKNISGDDSSCSHENSKVLNKQDETFTVNTDNSSSGW
jgi:hypothetical protein